MSDRDTTNVRLDADGHIVVSGRAGPLDLDAEIADAQRVLTLVRRGHDVLIAQLHPQQQWSREAGKAWSSVLLEVRPSLHAVAVVGCKSPIFRMGVSALALAFRSTMFFVNTLPEAKDKLEAHARKTGHRDRAA